MHMKSLGSAKSTGDRRGIIALITVISIGALILTIGLSAAFIGQTEVVISGDVDAENAARTLALGCVEEAIYRLKKDEGYLGGTVPVGDDSCVVEVSGSGATRTIEAAATVLERTKRISVEAQLRQNAAANARGWSAESWTEPDAP